MAKEPYSTHKDTFVALFTEIARLAGWPDPATKGLNTYSYYASWGIGPTNTATIIKSLNTNVPPAAWGDSHTSWEGQRL